MERKFLLYINLLWALFFILPTIQAGEKTFILVIDAGHGGKDPGARGTIVNEKEINLAVALKLGKLIEDNHNDVKVIYTRKTDRFIELDERANIANRNKADLFISIHTNAVARGNSAQGTETYTLGLARNDENLAVAMRENSAILLEDNYQQKYEGFDPNSSESYIIFEFIQNKHVEQSVNLASEVQKCFTSADRSNRGVRQAGFLVLRKTSMPSILVELGYISNRNEERFLKSDNGRNRLATAIYNAFTKYKKDYDRRQGSASTQTSVVSLLSYSDNTTIETASSEANLSETDVIGITNNDGSLPPPGSEADILRRKQLQNGNQRSKQPKTTSRRTEKSIQENQPVQVNTNTKGKVIYKIQILSSEKKLSDNSHLLKGYKDVSFYKEKGFYKYTYGETTSFDKIRKLRREVARDFKDAFIVAFKDGEKVNY